MNEIALATAIPVSEAFTQSAGQVLRLLFASGTGSLLLGLMLTFLSLNLLSSKRGKISTGRFGGWSEKWAAGRIATQQRRQRKHNQVTLRVGMLNLTQAQQGSAVCGAPGSGKTFGMIDPAIRDAIRQGFPILLYDFKGSQIEAHAAYAARMGYNVQVFAPGFDYTGVCNPLDLVRDASDAVMAGQLAEVIYKNASRGKAAHENDFFTYAGQKLVEAVMLLAKHTDYPDLLMAKKILNLSNLPTRIRLAAQNDKVPSWTMESFSQLISSEEAEKQVAGIIATAQRTFDRFISRELMPSFVGQTTIPLDLTGKQILFLQADIQRREMVAPLLASVLHLIITRNFAQNRKEPLVLSLDELPTLRLEGLAKWVNEFRSYGFCPILGYQNFAQLQDTYGRELARSIIAACGTKVFFNPRDEETASMISRYLGEKEVRLYTRSHSSGAQRSTSRNEQYQKVQLLTIDEILRFDQGECVFINAGSRSQNQAYVPLKLKIRLPDSEIRIQNQSESLWKEVVKDRLIARTSQQRLAIQELDREAEKRQHLAEELFPLKETARSDSIETEITETVDQEADFDADDYIEQ
jgi:type IV secretion system protein VirD4